MVKTSVDSASAGVGIVERHYALRLEIVQSYAFCRSARAGDFMQKLVKEIDPCFRIGDDLLAQRHRLFRFQPQLFETGGDLLKGHAHTSAPLKSWALRGAFVFLLTFGTSTPLFWRKCAANRLIASGSV